MGANQSTLGGNDDFTQTTNGELKTCYYELLGVDRQASDEDLKKAYRKKALELHPDRNYGNVEETTKLFAAVQSAYEVLSDPQERAWYDSHRSAILRGQDEQSNEHYEYNVRVTTSEDIMVMFTKLNGRMDFSDSSSGFFTILRNTFDTLAKEEALTCDWEGLERIDYPSFGHARDNYERVVRPFYAVWNGFATRKPFSWKDVYRYSDAPDRRVRRMMEKENKRSRDDAIREFNETIRSLVQFVRKRDPRYIPNTQTEAERQKVIRDAATAQAARARAANNAKAAQQGPIPLWTQKDGPIEEEISDEEEEKQPEEQLECVVCRKTFKSEKQFEAHERSKKHLKAVHQLQREMRSENQVLNLDSEDAGEIREVFDSVIEVAKDNNEPGTRPSGASGGLDAREDPDNSVFSRKHLNASPDYKAKAYAAKADISAPASDDASTSSTDDDYASRDTIEQRILGNTERPDTGLSTLQFATDDLTQKLAKGSPSDNKQDAASQPKLGKAKAKRAKKAAQQNTTPSAVQFKCVACNAGFPSKTSLFLHIKDFGHAQPVPKAVKGGKGKRR